MSPALAPSGISTVTDPSPSRVERRRLENATRNQTPRAAARTSASANSLRPYRRRPPCACRRAPRPASRPTPRAAAKPLPDGVPSSGRPLARGRTRGPLRCGCGGCGGRGGLGPAAPAPTRRWSLRGRLRRCRLIPLARFLPPSLPLAAPTLPLNRGGIVAAELVGRRPAPHPADAGSPPCRRTSLRAQPRFPAR